MRTKDILHEIAVNDMLAASLSYIREDGHRDHRAPGSGYQDSSFELLKMQLEIIKQELPRATERLRVEVALAHIEAATNEIRTLYERRIE